MRCRDLHTVAKVAFLEGFPFSELQRVAPYCVPGGIRVVSDVRELRLAGSLAPNSQVAMTTAYPRRSVSYARLRFVMGNGISMPCSAAISKILPTSG
jgi:hypothetical protein